MAREIKIIGSNPISEKSRYDALKELNQLDDLTLSRIAQLARSSKAKSYITNKWLMVKSFLGV